MSITKRQQAKKHQPKKRNPFAMMQTEPLPVPYESLVGHPVTEPIMSKELELKVLSAIVPYKNRIMWEKWGMDKIKKAGTALLLTGPSGTGKTTIARFLAKRISPGIISVTMADLGGSDPGETERNLRRVFEKGKEEGNVCIFIDECDSILWSREKAGPDSMWMLAVVNEVLMLIEKYEGFIVLATNNAHVLDPALQRRLSDVIEVEKPGYETRLSLWMQKLPSEFPYEPTNGELHKLANIELTGAEIENCIIAEAKLAIHEKRKPKFTSLYESARHAASAD